MWVRPHLYAERSPHFRSGRDAGWVDHISCCHVPSLAGPLARQSTGDRAAAGPAGGRTCWAEARAGPNRPSYAAEQRDSGEFISAAPPVGKGCDYCCESAMRVPGTATAAPPCRCSKPRRKTPWIGLSLRPAASRDADQLQAWSNCCMSGKRLPLRAIRVAAGRVRVCVSRSFVWSVYVPPLYLPRPHPRPRHKGAAVQTQPAER